MKIPALIHGIIDYVTVLFLIIAPSLFEMQNTASTFTYVLAIIHLILTLVTDFSAGLLKIVPLKIHGMIELVVSAILIGAAVWFRALGDRVSFNFYLAFSIVLFVVWILSEYEQGDRKMSEKN